MFWLWLWMALTAGVMITSHITTARGDKWPSRALLEAIVANFRRTVGVAPVEYRGIRYTIRARIQRDQWSVAIHPAGVEMKGRVVIGSRRDAELQARAMIDSWLKRTARKILRASSTPQPT